MFKKSPLIIKICSAVTKHSIYALVFLLPILFLPWTSDVLDFNKQALLVPLVFIALFAWMAKVLVSGKFSVNLNKTYVAVLAVFVVYLLSTVFSLDKTASFWGWPRIVSESLLSVICLALLYFFISSVFSEKETLTSVKLLGISSLISAVIGFFQLLGIFIFPFFSFAKNTSFNTIGLVGGFGMFLAVLLPLLFALEISAKKWTKAVFGVFLALDAVILVLVNYPAVWWVVLTGSVLMILFGMIKRKFIDLRWASVPTFFLVVALFFIVLRPVISVPARSVEVFLNQSSSFNIALQAIKSEPGLGSGPGTFVYDFSKYKDNSFNQSALWNVRFDSASSKALTVLATTGVLGALAFLLLIGCIIFCGFKFLTSKEEPANESQTWILSGGLLIALVAQVVGYFLYKSNLSLDFTFFLLLAGFVGLAFKERKNYTLTPSSFLTLGVTFVFTIFLIFGAGLLVLYGQRYIAEINYFNGEVALAKGDLDKGIKGLESAVSRNPGMDIYLTELSQVYLSKAQSQSAKKDLSDQDKKDIQVLVSNAINASKIATDVSGNNVSNWSIRGFIYQNLIGVVPKAEDWAITSYDRAFELEPTNPYYPTQEGIVLMKKSTLPDYAQSKNQLLDQANEKFNSAVQLKSDYSPARYQIAMVYQAQGKTSQEISALEQAIRNSPNDVGLAFQIGLVYYQEGNYQSARAALERATALNPNYANALYFLGLVYDKLGIRDKAIAEFQKVFELNPDNAQVKTILANLKAKKPALTGISQPTQAPVQEPPPEKTKP